MIQIGRTVRQFLVAGLAAVASPGLAKADNPFGVMLFPNPGEDFNLALARARGLGVAWFRPPTIAMLSGSIGSPPVFIRSGLKLAITVRNAADASSPATAPSDLAAFRKSIAAILAAWHPSLLAVESEDVDGADKDVAVARKAYGAELAAACAAAHEAKVLCTNGGLSGSTAADLTWYGFLEAKQPDRACDFIRRASGNDAACRYRSVDELRNGQRNYPGILDFYRSAPIDLINFHWFGGDSRAFAEIANDLARAVGKPAITNELGQRPGADPNGVRPLLRAVVAEGMPIAIWYSIDTRDTVALFGRDGRLTMNGWEFQRQLAGLR